MLCCSVLYYVEMNEIYVVLLGMRTEILRITSLSNGFGKIPMHLKRERGTGGKGGFIELDWIGLE